MNHTSNDLSVLIALAYEMERSTWGLQEKIKMVACRKQWRKSRVVKIDSQKSWDDSITQATKACYPVMVHFSAYWCMPSTSMELTFEKLASHYPNTLFLKLDVDEVKEVASKMNIKAMPTFLLMNKGEEMNKIVGANQTELKKLLDGFGNIIRSYDHEDQSGGN